MSHGHRLRPKVMGDDGEFHAVDEAVDLSGTPLEAWVALALFWAAGRRRCSTQFVTRYVLNDSASWTEEIARYLLIGTVFVGASHRRGEEQPHPGRPALPLPARRRWDGGCRAWSTCCASASSSP
jgi:hypothetical protein